MILHILASLCITFHRSMCSQSRGWNLVTVLGGPEEYKYHTPRAVPTPPRPPQLERA